MELTEDQKMGDHKGSTLRKMPRMYFTYQLRIMNYLAFSLSMGDHKGSPPTKNATDVFPHQLRITNYELSGVHIIHGRPQRIAPTKNATDVFPHQLRITHYEL
jgi:hypothetical protein